MASVFSSRTGRPLVIARRLSHVSAVICLVALTLGGAQGADCRRSDFRVAVDVGHTPEAQGAYSARGVPELTFNRALASEIVQTLGRAGYPTLLVTVHGKGTAQLIERTARAQAFGAKLFLAIHHDDVQSIYKSTWEVDGTTHPYSDRFSGHSLFVSAKNGDYAGSVAFARLLGQQLKTQGLRFTRHHAEKIPGEGRLLIDPDVGIYRYDDLIVLKRAASPAVLLEAGVIVNRADEVVLNGDERRKQIETAVLGAVDAFCLMREGPSGAPRRAQ
jgi:N-acetylmuramoyl-L-alanine amidase